jgi:N-acetylneuraminate lyase
MPSSDSVFPRGLVAAPFTPLHPDGSVRPEAIGPYAAALARTGVAAAFVCGTTGEGASLTTAERQVIAARWRTDKPEALRLIVHVGHTSLADSQDLARHAEGIGADAISAIAPGFFRPATVDALVDWCADVAAAAPSCPFYYYHMPALSGAHFAMVDFLPRAQARIPNFAGIKFTHENLFDYAQAVVAAGSTHAVLFGRDEILLGALALGATGAVGSTYNYMAPIFHRMIAAFDAGRLEEARREQLLAQQIIGIMSARGGLPAGKAIMSLIGLDCGPVRRPLATLDSVQVAGLRAELDQAGFFSAIGHP